jgi:hypothetical protein
MNNNARPAVLSAKMYGTKVSVEYDHSDIDLDEVMDAFQTLLTGLGYHPDGFKNWVIERADEYKEQDNQSEDFNEWDVTLEDGLEDDGDYIENPEWAVVGVINKLKQLEVDGEIMQYILEQVGMDEQMAIQLATMYPDVVEEHLAELKEENQPYISDNFQIGPDGAYEHEDEDEEIARAFENFIKTMKANTKNGK